MGAKSLERTTDLSFNLRFNDRGQAVAFIGFLEEAWFNLGCRCLVLAKLREYLRADRYLSIRGSVITGAVGGLNTVSEESLIIQSKSECPLPTWAYLFLVELVRSFDVGIFATPVELWGIQLL